MELGVEDPKKLEKTIRIKIESKKNPFLTDFLDLGKIPLWI